MRRPFLKSIQAAAAIEPGLELIAVLERRLVQAHDEKETLGVSAEEVAAASWRAAARGLDR